MRSVLFFSMLLASCTSDAHRLRGDDAGAGLPGAVDSSVTLDAAVDLGLLGGHALDSLTASELKALCEEGERRSDPCVEQGIAATDSEAACTAFVDECRSMLASAPAPSCDGITLGKPGSCAVTVADYLACVDAWNASLSCADAHYQAVPPGPCVTVRNGCAALASQFFVSGAPHPCTKAESVHVAPALEDGIVGSKRCLPFASRFVVLGDSIASCTGPTNDAHCTPYMIVAHLNEHREPDAGALAVEMHAWPGAKTADLIGQAQEVNGGPGHVYAYLFAIGNDLLGGNFDANHHLSEYAKVFDYFSDTERFPDGVTFLLNTQYTLWDECSVPGATKGNDPTLETLLVQVNQAVFLDVAMSRADAVAVDNRPDFLGHAENADITGCPFCGADNTKWIADALHPNDAGHAHMAAKWIRALDDRALPLCGAEAAH